MVSRSDRNWACRALLSVPCMPASSSIAASLIWHCTTSSSFSMVKRKASRSRSWPMILSRMSGIKSSRSTPVPKMPKSRCLSAAKAILRLLERNFGETAELSRVQSLGFLLLEPFQRLQADLEMLADAAAVEFAGHACELDLAVQRLVGDAQQRAVGDAKAVAIGGNRCRFHVERNRARLRQAANDVGPADLPIAVVDARDGAGAHQALELESFEPGDVLDRLLERHLHLRERRDRHPQRQLTIKHMVLAHIAMGEHVVAEPLRVAQARAMAEHQPGMGPQHGNMVGDIARVGRTGADVDQS